ncbi:type IX secretion system membrane protein PorP/SprF [Flavobacterium sp. NRK F10]|uniref:PorP/SprF family type IX secretion system membrane protein n=1 Tax=Flavobacterium sp. NRK F10 TaxID=2954931 RepID=UPI002090F8FE|nr:type IX secretion system membrane protein PorP/SprF [Flavobacterium sp. NRK F10]MCO6176121.1 type IX secretion system membrane protein PorP/SprF [Flavobacterium sp. NRK F10]
MKHNKFIIGIAVFVSFLTGNEIVAQQQPQYTQYMYNTMSINSGYTGTNGKLEATLLHRSQWVGLDGAPRTQVLGIHGETGARTGLGLSAVNDRIGPMSQQYINANFAYRLNISQNTILSLGINAGVNIMNIDWSEGMYQSQTDNAFNANINSSRLIIGSGGFLYGEKWYAGLSVPNFLITESYNDIEESVIRRKVHYYLQGGYVFDIGEDFKFKPAFLIKAVEGSPVTYDVSANFMYKERFVLGAGYRFTDAFSALAGFQITPSIFLGYAYDRSITNLQKYNDGSHEIILKFNLQSKSKFAKSPRFF